MTFKQRLSSNPRLISRVAAALVGFAVCLEVAHAMGLLEAVRLSGEHASEAILVACFILCFLLREEFGETEHAVKHLARTVESSANVATFSDRYKFQSHWKHMRENFGAFILLGVPPELFSPELQKLFDKGKRCSLFLDVDLETQELALDFLTKTQKSAPDVLKLYDCPFPLNDFWIIALDDTGVGAEALIFYPQQNETSADGLYLTGHAARSLASSVMPNLRPRTLSGETIGPIRIYSPDQVLMVLDKKGVFAQGMLDVDAGRVVQGVEEVCNEMKQQLQTTSAKLNVTLVCNERSLSILDSPDFLGWLEANYSAAKRGVEVCRILIVPRSLRRNTIVTKRIEEMRANGITVKLCDRESLESRFVEDFSLYDDKHVVYISRAGGGWLEDETCARISDSLEHVQHYKNIFQTLQQRAR